VVVARPRPAFIKNLHITGFVQNTSATWVNSSAMEYNKDRWGKLNRNSLASERNLLQIDVNDDFTENDSMFLRVRTQLSLGDRVS